MTTPALLTAQDCSGHIHLVIGSGPLAASRCTKTIQVGATPIVVSNDSQLHHTIEHYVQQGFARHVADEFKEEHLETLGRTEVDGFADVVFVTTPSSDPRGAHISQLCKRRRIPVNVVDAPTLCTFTLLSTHTDGPLQIGITTSGRGCKLSARIKREISSSLPPKFGEAIERLGIMRKRIWAEDYKTQVSAAAQLDPELEEEESGQNHKFNQLVKEGDISAATLRTRRMRWLTQICEYWPLARLAGISDEDVDIILAAYSSPHNAISIPTDTILPTLPSPKGTITLAGSGPGDPKLLTIATRDAIDAADYILADKLVPAEIVRLFENRKPHHIARKFPGNADAAQEEMHHLALTALNQGKHVLRLKQGDPYLYGRGAEEVAFFREHGFRPRVIPGVTSALSAPMFAEIPVTHRAVADEVVICTGTGRKGAAPDPPEYKASKTVVFLMALHRIQALIESLIDTSAAGTDDRKRWPKTTPCAVIERASCPDQRVIRTTLKHVCQAIEEEGSRPPGLLVVGNACEVLHKPIEGQRWTTEEGFRGLDEIGTEHAGLDILRDLANETKHMKDDITIPLIQAIGPAPIAVNAA